MKVLVVVDMQTDFTTGSLANPMAKEIIPKIVDKLNNVNKKNTLVLLTRDTHEINYMETLEGKKLPVPHCIKDTDGWNIASEIDSLICKSNGYLIHSDNEIDNNRIDKKTFGSDTLYRFLVDHADEIDEVEICGTCTGICVVSNALMARMALPNTPIIVDASCCACVTKESHKAALKTMEMCQIDVVNG